MLSLVPSIALLIPHILNDFIIIFSFTASHEFFTQVHNSEIVGRFIRPDAVIVYPKIVPPGAHTPPKLQMLPLDHKTLPILNTFFYVKRCVFWFEKYGISNGILRMEKEENIYPVVIL